MADWAGRAGRMIGSARDAARAEGRGRDQRRAGTAAGDPMAGQRADPKVLDHAADRRMGRRPDRRSVPGPRRVAQMACRPAPSIDPGTGRAAQSGGGDRESRSGGRALARTARAGLSHPGSQSLNGPDEDVRISDCRTSDLRTWADRSAGDLLPGRMGTDRGRSDPGPNGRRRVDRNPDGRNRDGRSLVGRPARAESPDRDGPDAGLRDADPPPGDRRRSAGRRNRSRPDGARRDGNRQRAVRRRANLRMPAGPIPRPVGAGQA